MEQQLVENLKWYELMYFHFFLSKKCIRGMKGVQSKCNQGYNPDTSYKTHIPKSFNKNHVPKLNSNKKINPKKTAKEIINKG